MNGRGGRIAVVAAALIVAAVVIATSLFTQHARPSDPPGGNVVVSQEHPSGSTATTSDSPAPTPTPTGLDMTNPPKGAPSAADIAKARARAEEFMLSINDYGYGDADINDFIKRSDKYLTPEMVYEYSEVADMVDNSDPNWQEYLRTKTRHKALVSDVAMVSFTADTVVFRIDYRSGDVAVGAALDDNATTDSTTVAMIRSGADWKVQATSLLYE